MNQSDIKRNYAIIGFGQFGKALARAFARKHIQVAVATTRQPDRFAAEAADIGPDVIPTTLEEAVKADIIFLAVRFGSHPDVASALHSWEGKIIVDVTNAYGVPTEELGGLPSAKVIEKAFTGSKLVKGFNHLISSVMSQDPALPGGRRAVFLTSDDDRAAAEIAGLAEDLGFAPVYLGELSKGGMLVHGYGHTWGRLIFQDLIKAN